MQDTCQRNTKGRALGLDRGGIGWRGNGREEVYRQQELSAK